MEAKIAKWGNGQGVRIPKSYLDLCGWQVNDAIRMEVKDGRITMEKASAHKTLEERAAPFGGKLGPYQEYDWGNPAGREVW